MQTTRVRDFQCTIEGCESAQLARGWCNKHWQRWSKYGDPLTIKIGRGQGYTMHVSGYRVLTRPDHPNADSKGRILEHRYVMSKILGRPLLSSEQVHHRNGVRSDNRPENLELWAGYQPTGGRVLDVLQVADEILERYGYLFPSIS